MILFNDEQEKLISEAIDWYNNSSEQVFQISGSAGTGKTTAGMQLSNNRCMVCHSAMLPSDLMEDFKFNEGKAEFIPSSLQIAMTKGLPIVLDEINLLPYETLTIRF